MNVARMKQHFPTAQRAKGRTSTVRLKTASGENIESQGHFAVSAITDEGHRTQVDVVDADVDMPILSGAMICEGGAAGCGLTFNQDGGDITDFKTGKNSHFIKRDGVYFIRLRVPRDSGNECKAVHPGFVRPGKP